MVLLPEQIESIKKEVMSVPVEEREAKIQEILSGLSPDEVQQLQGGGGGGQCPFCLMAEGKIEVRKVYEDEKCLAILDINPANKGHTLVFLKQHNSQLTELKEKESSHLFKVCTEISKAISSALDAKGINMFVASGQAAGQTAPHLLVNVIPRFSGDEVKFGWAAKKIPEGEMDQVKSKIAEKTKSIKIAAEQEVIVKKEPPKEERKGEHPRLRIA